MVGAAETDPVRRTTPGIEPPGTPPGDPVLEVTDLHVTFPGSRGRPPVRAVRGVGYTLRRGEVLGIVGESGSGKSTSALATVGLLPDSARVTGSVRLHGAELLGRPDRQVARVRGRAISMVFQHSLEALTPIHTIGWQVAEAVRTHQPALGRRRALARAVELLERVGIPDAGRRHQAFPHEISGGMRQRVMIAIAIANDPDVIICDEPTSALDVTIQAQVMEVLGTARRETGASIVMITHDLGVLAGFADRVLVMYAGHPVEVGPVEDVYHRPRMPYTIGLLGSVPRLAPRGEGAMAPIGGSPPSPADLPPGCPFAPRCPLARPECEEREPGLRPVDAVEHLAACVRAAEIGEKGWGAADIYRAPRPGSPRCPGSGERAAQPPRGDQPSRGARVRGEAPPRKARATVLRVDGLAKHFPLSRGSLLRRRVGTVRAVAEVTFDIAEGETFALVGESGSGKTSTLMGILDLTRPRHGRVEVLGRETGVMSARERFAVRRELQVVFQDPTSSLDPRMPVFDIVAEPLRTHRFPARELDGRVGALLRQVGMDPGDAGRYPQQLSGGQRQRVAIARAIALEPRLLLLDEPVSDLDVSVQASIIDLLERLKARLGMSYLFVAHDLAVVRHIADRVGVLHLGRIVEIGEVERVYTAPAHPYTRALLSAVPIPDPRLERERTPLVLRGEPPDPATPPSGCGFRTRCPTFAALPEYARSRCRELPPGVSLVGEGDHGVACHYPQRR